MLRFLLSITAAIFAATAMASTASGPSEERCRDYRNEIKQLSNSMMDHQLSPAFRLDSSRNLETLGELQKEHAKLMAELVLINGMKEINRGTRETFGASEAINAYNALDDDQQRAMFPQDNVFNAALSSYEQRTTQIAMHMVLDEALTDLSTIPAEEIRALNTANADESAEQIISRVCQQRRESVLCEIAGSEDSSRRNTLRGLLSNYATAIQNGSINNPSITPTELQAILNNGISTDFLVEYNDHYQSFVSMASLGEEFDDCADSACEEAVRQNYFRQYISFRDRDEQLFSQYASQMIGDNPSQQQIISGINEQLQEQLNTAEVASRTNEGGINPRFDRQREVSSILRSMMRYACEGGCDQFLRVDEDGNIQLDNSFANQFSETNIDRRVTEIKATLQRMNQTIAGIHNSESIRNLNGIINYLSSPLNYTKFCPRGNRFSAQATCSYDQNSNLQQIGRIIRQGREVLAHTYLNSPRMQLSGLRQFCDSQRARINSNEIFQRRWGQTCSLAAINHSIEENSSADLQVFNDVQFDPRTGEQFRVERPPYVILNGALQGLMPSIGRNVQLYYASQSMNHYLTHGESYWIVPPSRYYYNDPYANMFNTSWSYGGAYGHGFSF